MLQVLADRGLRPDLLVGTSVGALNAAFLAGRGFSAGTVDELEAIWRSVRRVDVAVLASAAIPAVFPPVEIDGRLLYDGGLADNAPISKAVALGATRVFVLPTGYACALSEPPRSVLGHALHALTLLIERRLILDVAHYADVVEMTVLPPLCPLSVGPADFRHTGELIERARTATRTWLDDGGAGVAHPERFLSFHRHAHDARLDARNAVCKSSDDR
jgi:NTE family protein